MEKQEILTIISLVVLALALLSGLGGMASKNAKTKEKLNQICALLVFLAVVLIGVSQLTEEGYENEKGEETSTRAFPVTESTPTCWPPGTYVADWNYAPACCSGSKGMDRGDPDRWVPDGGGGGGRCNCVSGKLGCVPWPGKCGSNGRCEKTADGRPPLGPDGSPKTCTEDSDCEKPRVYCPSLDYWQCSGSAAADECWGEIQDKGYRCSNYPSVYSAPEGAPWWVCPDDGYKTKFYTNNKEGDPYNSCSKQCKGTCKLSSGPDYKAPTGSAYWSCSEGIPHATYSKYNDDKDLNNSCDRSCKSKCTPVGGGTGTCAALWNQYTTTGETCLQATKQSVCNINCNKGKKKGGEIVDCQEDSAPFCKDWLDCSKFSQDCISVG